MKIDYLTFLNIKAPSFGRGCVGLGEWRQSSAAI